MKAHDQQTSDAVNRCLKHTGLARERLEELAEHGDPTASKRYLPWLAKLLKGGLLEDASSLPCIRQRLADFESLRRAKRIRGPDADILRYRSVEGLDEALSKANDGAFCTLRRPPWEAWRLSTVAACMRMTHGTTWCVRHMGHATAYVNRGPLYLLLHEAKPWALAHEASGSLKDAENVSLEIDDPQTVFALLQDIGVRNFSLGELRQVRLMAAGGPQMTAGSGGWVHTDRCGERCMLTLAGRQMPVVMVGGWPPVMRQQVDWMSMVPGGRQYPICGMQRFEEIEMAVDPQTARFWQHEMQECGARQVEIARHDGSTWRFQAVMTRYEAQYSFCGGGVLNVYMQPLENMEVMANGPHIVAG